MRPIIGITTYVEQVAWADWQPRPAALLPYEYIRCVTEAGGRAVLVPPDGLDGPDGGLVAALDGLVFHQVTSGAPGRTEEGVDALRRLLAAHRAQA